MYNIYQISGPEGKIYIGQTVKSLEKRWQYHKYAMKYNRRSYFTNALKKHGSENFRIFWLGSAKTKEEANDLEKLYIRLFKANDEEFGYNTSEGGDGVTFTEAVKNKIGASTKERWKNPEYRKRCTKKIGSVAHNKGKKSSKETCQKISEARKGIKPHNFLHDLDISRLVYEYNKCHSLIEVSRIMGISRATVWRRLKALEA